MVCLRGWWLFGSRRLVPGVWLDGLLLAGWGCVGGWFLLMDFGGVSLVIAGGGLVGWVGSVPGLGCAVGWFLVAGGWRGLCRGSRFFWLAGL